jgi:aspartate dehydrogenase
LAGIADRPELGPEVARLAEEHGCASTLDPRALPDLGADLVVEAASHAAVATYATGWLERGADVLLMSIGALGDDKLRQEIFEAAASCDRSVFVPSGAIGGLDLLRSARVGRIDAVHLTTSKPPTTLGVEVDGAAGPSVLFDGPASDAVRAFPQNVNVAAAVSLSGIGFDRTRVTVVADPSLTVIVHELEITGEFGRARVTLSNEPDTINPKTSRLAIMSAVALIERLDAPIRLG